MSNRKDIFLRSLIKEILLESTTGRPDEPVRYTPQGIMTWKSSKLLSTVVPGSRLDEPEFFLSNYPISNFYPADSESETILQFNSMSAPIDEILNLGCEPVPEKYVSNTSSMFMKTLSNKFKSNEALVRYTEIVKNVKDKDTLQQSRPYNSTQTYFVITSSTNPNFKVTGGQVENVVGDSLTDLFKKMIANPLTGYGIWITTLPRSVQEDTITTLNVLQTGLSILTVVPGFNKVAAVANLGPSLALASYYAATHKNIDPNAKVEIPYIDAEVKAKYLNYVNVGGNLLAGVAGCYGGVMQFVSQVNALQRLRTLSGFNRFLSSGSASITTLDDLRQAYVGLGSNFRLASSFTDNLGNTISTSTAGWQAVEGGFVYVTGSGNTWLNNVTRIGIIADVAGDAVVFTQQEVNLVNSLLKGRNYWIIGQQIQAVIEGSSSLWMKAGATIDIVGAALDVWSLEQLLSSIPNRTDTINNDITPEEMTESVPSMFSELVIDYRTNIAGGNWNSLFPADPNKINVIDAVTKKVKLIPPVKFDSSLNNYINKQDNKSFTPRAIIVSSDLFPAIESIAKLKSSLGRHYSWKVTDAGTVFIVVSKEFITSTIN